MMEFLPYKNKTNYVFNLESMHQLDIIKNDCLNEKIYAYACFMPPGKYSSCVLYNNDNKSQKSKSIYTMMVKVPVRDYNIERKHKKIRKYQVERKFFMDNSIFKD